MMKRRPNICILNYGAGNITSIFNAIKFLGYKSKVSNEPEDINNATHWILPGVGSYIKAMDKIKSNLPLKVIKTVVYKKKIPLFRYRTDETITGATNGGKDKYR